MAELNTTDPRLRGAPLSTPANVPGGAPASGPRSGQPSAPTGAPGPANSDPAATYQRTVQNKYAGQTPASPGGPDGALGAAQGMFAEAGQPLPTAAAMQRVNENVPANDPRLQGLRTTLQGAMADPNPAQAAGNAQKVHAEASRAAEGLGVNAWGLVLKALAGAAKDAQADQELRIKKLQHLSAIQTAMQPYGDRLQQVSQDLTAKIGTGKKADQNAQVPFPDQTSFPNLENLDKDGNVIKQSMIKEGVQSHKDPGELELKKTKGDEYTFGAASGDDIKVHGTNENDARAQAAVEYNQRADSNNESNKHAMVNTSGLSSLQQRYSQALDQLQNKIQQASSDLQNGVQTQQTQYSTASSIIKTIGDLGGSLSRNLLG